MLIVRSLVGIGVMLAAVGCKRASDPGFDLVTVPQSAYGPTDASAGDAGKDAAHLGNDNAAVIVCVAPKAHDDDTSDDDAGASDSEDTESEFPDCASRHEDRVFDLRATKRHRGKDEEVCCYRKKRGGTSREDE